MQRDGGPGGGAGGLGSGGSFTGAAETLDIYGDYAAAYSGPIATALSNVTHLEFTTGNYLFVGEISGLMPIATADITNGGIALFIVSFNDVTLFSFKGESAAEDMPTIVTLPILIPAYTEVKVEAESQYANQITSANVIGRIYRG